MRYYRKNINKRVLRFSIKLIQYFHYAFFYFFYRYFNIFAIYHVLFNVLPSLNVLVHCELIRYFNLGAKKTIHYNTITFYPYTMVTIKIHFVSLTSSVHITLKNFYNCVVQNGHYFFTKYHTLNFYIVEIIHCAQSQPINLN